MSRSDRGGLPDQPRATGAPSVIPAPPASFLRPLRHSCAPSVIPAPYPSFLRRQESMRPINRATSLHPPDGPPEPPPRVIGRRRTLGVPLTPTDRLDSCLRRNDGGGGAILSDRIQRRQRFGAEPPFCPLPAPARRLARSIIREAWREHDSPTPAPSRAPQPPDPYSPARSRNAAASSVCSHGRARSVRPKCPYAAVGS